MAHIIGIDLGTTYSAVATIGSNGHPYILKNQNGGELTPSVIYFDPDGAILVGQDAKDKLQEGEENIAMFFKRNMGNPDFRFYAGDKEYTATDLSAILLRKLKEDAEVTLGETITEAVITVPAYFNDIQRTETIKAGKMAGLDVKRIINEPTAAAITYGISRDSVQKVLVYDLGGGTFDVTILEVTPDEIRVLATGGDHELGGKDWDDCILSYVVEQFKDEFGVDPSDELEVYNDLALQCENLKKRLTQRQADSITVRYKGCSRKYEFTRQKFEELTSYLMNSTQAKAEEVLTDAGLSWRDISGALLVGGSTRMPMVENWVRQMSGHEPVRGINVDQAVAFGAAILAGQIQQKQFFISGGSKPQFSIAGSKKIADVMSHSLGAVAVSEDGSKYVNSIIIGKNKAIPITAKRSFRHNTRSNGKNEMEIYLTQGESTDVHNILVVSKYVLEGIQHLPSGETIIEIEYSYDENGVINVSGFQKETGCQLNVRKEPLPDDMGWLYEKPKGVAGPMSVILAVDISGSMAGKAIKQAKAAAHEFMTKIDLKTSEISIVGFESRIHVMCELSQSEHTISQAIDKLDAKGGTNSPLNHCYRVLRHTDNKPVIVLLTDGAWFDQNEALITAQTCKNAGIDIIAVGFGSADKKFLGQIATVSMMTDINSLVDSFSTIATELSTNGSVSGLSLR